MIPEIEQGKLEELAARIKPVVREQSDLHYIEACDLRRTAFTWDAKSTGVAKDLVELGRIETKHTYGYALLFKPSVAEVLAQIPEKFIDKVAAFEVIAPQTVPDGRYHVADTILYSLGEQN